MRRLAVLLVVSAGCVQDFSIFDPSDAEPGDVSADNTQPPDGAPPVDGGTDSTVSDAPVDVGADVFEAGCNPAACPGYRCALAGDASVCEDYTSCLDMHTQAPSIPTGTYEMGPGDASVYTAYCDMTTSGGGFTLVARSVNNGSASSFGWAAATGSLADDTKPYALGVLNVGLSFNTLLVGDVGGGKSFAGHVYRLTVPQNLNGCASSACAVTQITTVAGPCQSPSLLADVGFTSQAAQLFFDGQTTLSSHGLFPGGWSLPGNPTCNTGGRLDGTQGMIFVR